MNKNANRAAGHGRGLSRAMCGVADALGPGLSHYPDLGRLDPRENRHSVLLRFVASS